MYGLSLIIIAGLVLELDNLISLGFLSVLLVYHLVALSH